MESPNKQQIEEIIYELCSEDDYGSWELWWAVKGRVVSDTDTLRRCFVQTVKSMVEKAILKPKNKDSKGLFVEANFEPRRLDSEIDQASNIKPESFYWFGTK